MGNEAARSELLLAEDYVEYASVPWRLGMARWRTAVAATLLVCAGGSTTFANDCGPQRDTYYLQRTLQSATLYIACLEGGGTALPSSKPGGWSAPVFFKPGSFGPPTAYQVKEFLERLKAEGNLPEDVWADTLLQTMGSDVQLIRPEPGKDMMAYQRFTPGQGWTDITTLTVAPQTMDKSIRAYLRYGNPKLLLDLRKSPAGPGISGGYGGVE